MNKALLFSLILGSFTCFSFYQTNNNTGAQKDKAATKLLKDVSKKYKSYKTLKADFTVLTEPADPKAVKKTDKGSLWSKGSNFKLVYAGQEIYCNGKFIWTYTIESQECTKENYKPNTGNGLNPSKIFSIWEKGFLYASDGTYKKGTSEIAKIKLTPEDKAKPYFLMNLEVDKTTKQIQNLKVSFKTGVKQTYTVTSQTPNSSIDDKSFEWDQTKHAGVELIDLTSKKG